MSKPVIAETPGEGPRIDPTKPIVIRRKASVGWKVAGAGVFFGGLGCIIWSISVSAHPIAANVYGAMLIAVAMYGLWRGVEEAIRRPSAVVVSREGVKVLRGRALHLIQWSDIKGAHAATIGGLRKSDEIVALQLVDPQSFHARFHGNKGHWLWPGSSKRPNCYPIYSGDLDIARPKLIELLDDGIRRWGTYDPELQPQTNYGVFWNWEPLHASHIAILLIAFVALLAAPFALGSAPRWVEAAKDCDVRNPYGVKQWRSMRAVWTGPCVDGRADGEGTLEWFLKGRRTERYSGRMEGGRITGRGERTEYGTTWGLGQLIKYEIRYDGLWKDGVLLEGTVAFPDERQYRGTWKLGEWATGMLTMPGGWQWEGQWHAGWLTGEGRAKGRQGEFKGHWTNGVPQGVGVFVTRDGRRFEGTWKGGKPVDAEMAHLQEQERWDCLWTVLPGRYDTPIRSEPWGCRIQ